MLEPCRLSTLPDIVAGVPDFQESLDSSLASRRINSHPFRCINTDGEIHDAQIWCKCSLGISPDNWNISRVDLCTEMIPKFYRNLAVGTWFYKLESVSQLVYWILHVLMESCGDPRAISAKHCVSVWLIGPKPFNTTNNNFSQLWQKEPRHPYILLYTSSNSLFVTIDAYELQTFLMIPLRQHVAFSIPYDSRQWNAVYGFLLWQQLHGSSRAFQTRQWHVPFSGGYTIRLHSVSQIYGHHSSPPLVNKCWNKVLVTTGLKT